MSQINNYSTLAKILFWLFWLLGLAIALPFIGFILILGKESWPIVLWNSMAAMVEIFILFISARSFLRGDRALSTLMLWLGIAVIAVPMISFSGCMMFGSSMRFAG